MTSNAESLIVAHFELSIIVPFRLWAPEWERKGTPKFHDLVCGLRKDAVWSESEPTRDNDAAWNAARKYQSSAYFHPFVRQFLHGGKRVRRLYRDDVAALEFTPEVVPPFPPAPARRLSVKGCSLWLFAPGIGALQLDLRARTDDERMRTDDERMRTDKEPPWTLLDVQLALDQLRRLYPPYFWGMDDGPKGGGHCPTSVDIVLNNGRPKFAGDFTDYERFIKEASQWLEAPDKGTPQAERAHSFPWSRHWKKLLAPLVTEPPEKGVSPPGIHALQLGDDRAPVMSFVGFIDQPTLRNVDCGNWVRLCFASTPGTDKLPYQREFLAGFEKRFCYDRFWYRSGESIESPSRIMNCGDAFSWAGSAKDTGYFMDDRNGALATFRHIYVPMGMIAHFHRAALLAASAQLSALIEVDNADRYKKQLQELYHRFIEFTQVFWFDEISPQEQGRELFAVWRRELRTQELFDEVRQELRDMTDLQHTQLQIDQVQEATWLSEIALPFVVVTVAASLVSMLAAFLGMNTLDFETDKSVSICTPWLSDSRCRLNWIVALTMAAVPFIIAPVVIWKRKWILDKFFGRRPSSDDRVSENS